MKRSPRAARHASMARRSKATWRSSVTNPFHQSRNHQLGLDYKKMEYEFIGRTFRLVEEGGGPIKQILACPPGLKLR